MLLNPEVLALAGNIRRNHSTSSGSEQGPHERRARRASTPTRESPSPQVALGSIPRSPSDESLSAFTLDHRWCSFRRMAPRMCRPSS
jgi:hypothetical protein